MIQRRSILKSLLAAPFIITTPGLLMPIKRIQRYSMDDKVALNNLYGKFPVIDYGGNWILLRSYDYSIIKEV